MVILIILTNDGKPPQKHEHSTMDAAHAALADARVQSNYAGYGIVSVEDRPTLEWIEDPDKEPCEECAKARESVYRGKK